MIRLCLVSGLPNTLVDSSLAVLADLRIALLEVFAELGVFPLVGRISRVIRVREVGSQRLQEKVLIPNAFSAEQASLVEIKRFEGRSRFIRSFLRIGRCGRGIGNLSVLRVRIVSTLHHGETSQGNQPRRDSSLPRNACSASRERFLVPHRRSASRSKSSGVASGIEKPSHPTDGDGKAKSYGVLQGKKAAGKIRGNGGS